MLLILARVILWGILLGCVMCMGLDIVRKVDDGETGFVLAVLAALAWAMYYTGALGL